MTTKRTQDPANLKLLFSGEHIVEYLQAKLHIFDDKVMVWVPFQSKFCVAETDYAAVRGGILTAVIDLAGEYCARTIVVRGHIPIFNCNIYFYSPFERGDNIVAIATVRNQSPLFIDVSIDLFGTKSDYAHFSKNVLGINGEHIEDTKNGARVHARIAFVKRV